jgi:hypothetical protein
MENFTLAQIDKLAMPQLSAGLLLILLSILIYSTVLKGVALWKAARNGQKKWFIVLLIVNTMGILELLYIFVFSEKNNKSSNKQKHEQ